MTATILRAGFFSSVQDLGRIGYRESGVSPGGALDSHALRVANVLVGNDASAAGIEATLGQMRIGFDDDRLVAWAGGDFHVRIGETELPAGRAGVIHGGEELLVTAAENGARAWIAIAGGIDLPRVLGSRSTDLRSHFGGLDGRALRDGGVLPLGLLSSEATVIQKKIGDLKIANWGAPSEWISTVPRHPFLRVVKGADWSLFEASAQNALMQESFTVRSDSDRMGVRFDGVSIAASAADELVSEAVVPGTIQVPPSGKPMLLLGDCQTIGGYPKIAHVITVDLPAAAQLRPGALVRFAEMTLNEARQLFIERERDFQRFRVGLSLRLL